MTAAFLVAQLLFAEPVMLITPSGPPLKPADAAATLRRASPDLDLSRGLFRLDDLPLMINMSPAPARREWPAGLVVPRVAVPPRPEPSSLSWQAEPCGGPRGPVCATVVVIDRR
jgi:hypothetical protein